MKRVRALLLTDIHRGERDGRRSGQCAADKRKRRTEQRGSSAAACADPFV